MSGTRGCEVSCPDLGDRVNLCRVGSTIGMLAVAALLLDESPDAQTRRPMTLLRGVRLSGV